MSGHSLTPAVCSSTTFRPESSSLNSSGKVVSGKYKIHALTASWCDQWSSCIYFIIRTTQQLEHFSDCKLALVGIIPNQILFSFSSDKDRRTDSRIRRKKKTQRSPAGNRTQGLANSSPGGAALCFFVWPGCQFFYLCRSWKRREFLRLLECHSVPLPEEDLMIQVKTARNSRS